jgi:hypothetical protein
LAKRLACLDGWHAASAGRANPLPAAAGNCYVHRVFRLLSRRLFVVLLAATIVVFGFAPASGAVKKKVKTTKSVKVPKAIPAEDRALLDQVGPLTGSAAAIRDVLVSKWRFPSWFPPMPGTIVNVADYRSVEDGRSDRETTVSSLVPGSLTAEQFADQIAAPAGLKRNPVGVGMFSGGLLASHAVQFLPEVGRFPRIQVEVSDGPVIEGKRLVSVSYFEKVDRPFDLPFASSELTANLVLPEGAGVTFASFVIQNHTMVQGRDAFTYERVEANLDYRVIYTGSQTIIANLLPRLPKGFVVALKEATSLVAYRGDIDISVKGFPSGGGGIAAVSTRFPQLLA